ncbi:hypothetical protein H1Z99_005021 [Salmonella enterica subsp. enterica serovar Meleagridis]|nr:hypothetical protein [Salmonella enterica subsp. enterica serovar Cerro]EGD4263823.1 hypothetical protein [Salmonella enterica subsp. enterica serovar Cerro]EGD4268224.1 hypothetical protein [Salmonella enterica subsp. enterica serovar Cerro]EGD4276734.1 hypothetical protein [Salmonella enterica subsp. enterica serovar Meleagridis]EGD4286763.1 hypothetical protein [Salmonella enterica subsp. enterica serovar Meleagridis]
MTALKDAIKPTPMAFFQASQWRIWSYAVESGGEWRSKFGGQTLAQMREDMPDMELIPTEEAVRRENEHNRIPWHEINEARYIAQLEQLPPMDWNTWAGCESFKSAELYAADVTSIFARFRGRFFECRDLVTLTPQQICEVITSTFFAVVP